MGQDLQVKIQQFYAGKMNILYFNSGAGGDNEGGSKITLGDDELCSPNSDKEDEVLHRSDSKDELFEDKLKKDTVFKIVELILDHKPNLYSQFMKMDSERQSKTRIPFHSP